MGFFRTRSKSRTTLYRASIRFMMSTAMPSCVASRCIFSSFFRALFFRFLSAPFFFLCCVRSFVLLFWLFCSRVFRFQDALLV